MKNKQRKKLIRNMNHYIKSFNKQLDADERFPGWHMHWEISEEKRSTNWTYGRPDVIPTHVTLRRKNYVTEDGFKKIVYSKTISEKDKRSISLHIDENNLITVTNIKVLNPYWGKHGEDYGFEVLNNYGLPAGSLVSDMDEFLDPLYPHDEVTVKVEFVDYNEVEDAAYIDMVRGEYLNLKANKIPYDYTCWDTSYTEIYGTIHVTNSLHPEWNFDLECNIDSKRCWCDNYPWDNIISSNVYPQHIWEFMNDALQQGEREEENVR